MKRIINGRRYDTDSNRYEPSISRAGLALAGNLRPRDPPKHLVFSLKGMLCKSITEPPVLIFARSDH